VNAVLAALDPEQRAVATALHGPVCVLAGAGTGKTRAITHRIAHGVLSGAYVPQQILAVTFTTRAAGELRGRLRELGAAGVQARTFHSAALRQLQYFWPRAVGGEPPRIVDSKAPLVTEAAGRSRLRLSRPELRDLAAEIEWAKVTMAAPDDYPAAAAKAARIPPAGLDPASMARLYAGYEEVKRRRGVMDLEDVLLLTVGVLEDRPDAADTVREQYRHFVVDEYQDVSPLQQRLLDLWLGDRDSVCVVGDAAQTIYSFAGATPDFLLGFTRRHPSATVVRLVRDYRSTPQVVGLANRLLASARGEVARQRVQLQAQRPDGPAPTFSECTDEPAEAADVARRIRHLIEGGVRPAEIAVLFRTNAQSETYESALAEAGVPYVLKGAERFFERPEVREARVLLRGAARSDDRSAEPLAEQVRAVLSTAGWTPEPPAHSGAARERWESVAAVVRLAEEFAAATQGAGLAEFVAELDERAAAQHALTVEGVTLASLHAAKGLEWDAVFLVGLVEGMVPITYAETPEQVEEERRLLYVGMTRAREHLALSWALARSPGGRAGRRPSRFLDGLRPGGSATADGTGSRSATTARARRDGIPRCRVCGHPLADPVPRKLGRCETCPSSLDEELYERLRSWRLERAREQSLPAFCIFTDATLAAIAETRPASERELTRIPGVGRTKLDKYGADVLALCAGGPPA
jgi:DNA helicase-2/ATP-dependent DNA helicase PcrA